MNELQLSSSTDTSSQPQEGTEEKELRRSAIISTMNETILKLLKRVETSLNEGKRQEEQLITQINQSERTLEVLNEAHRRSLLTRFERSHLPVKYQEEERFLIYFENKHIAQDKKYRADTFFGVFCVLIWNLLKYYDAPNFEKLTKLISNADFSKYPQTYEYTEKSVDPARIAELTTSYLNDMKSKSTPQLAKSDNSFREFISYATKYAMLEVAGAQNMTLLRRTRQEGDSTWKTVQQPLEYIIVEDLADMGLKKTEDGKHCFLLPKGKLVINQEGNEFVGHVETLPT